MRNEILVVEKSSLVLVIKPLFIKVSGCNPSAFSIKSLTSLWKGAELQEREIWDLMGIYFDDHPNMKRILLWEGFEGHPLRKDFIK